MILSLFVIDIVGSYGEDTPCSEETPEDGWVSAGVAELDDYCYMKISQARSWQYSNDHCRHHGGYLASVHTQAENDYIKGDYWIGLIKVQPGTQRRWSDNTIQDFTHWAENGKYTKIKFCITYSP